MPSDWKASGVSVREFGRAGGQVGGDPAGSLHVHGVTGVVGGGLALHPGERGLVHLLGGRGQRRQAAGDQDRTQPLGRGAEVVGGAEAAEALPQDGPGRAAGQAGPDGLGVAHDGVGAEVGQVVGLLGRSAAQRQGLPVDRGGAAGPALVEEQDAVLGQGPVEPRLPSDEPACAEAGAALQVQQPRQCPRVLAGGDDLAGVELDLLAVRVRVVQGDGEPVVGEDRSGLAVAVLCGHGGAPGVRGAKYRAPGRVAAGARMWRSGRVYYGARYGAQWAAGAYRNSTTERSTSPRSIRANASSTPSSGIVSDTKASRSRRPCR